MPLWQQVACGTATLRQFRIGETGIELPSWRAVETVAFRAVEGEEEGFRGLGSQVTVGCEVVAFVPSAVPLLVVQT